MRPAARRRRARGGNGLASILHDLAAVLALGLLGRVTEAAAAADEVEQAARVSANPQLIQWALWMRAWVLMESGRLDAALAAAQESVELAAGLDDSASPTVARAVLGAVLGARGEHARARDLLAAYDIDHGWICRWAPHLVESDIALGDLAAAREHAERAAALAPGTGMAGARAAAGRAQALVALADGDAPRAAALALAAADEATAAGALLEAARDRLVAGRALLATDRDAGIAQLTAAGEQAGRCGAPRVADEARLALRRAGVRVGRGGARAPGTEGLAGLSPASARSPSSSPKASPTARSRRGSSSARRPSRRTSRASSRSSGCAPACRSRRRWRGPARASAGTYPAAASSAFRRSRTSTGSGSTPRSAAR